MPPRTPPFLTTPSTPHRQRHQRLSRNHGPLRIAVKHRAPLLSPSRHALRRLHHAAPHGRRLAALWPAVRSRRRDRRGTNVPARGAGDRGRRAGAGHGGARGTGRSPGMFTSTFSGGGTSNSDNRCSREASARSVARPKAELSLSTTRSRSAAPRSQL